MPISVQVPLEVLQPWESAQQRLPKWETKSLSSSGHLMAFHSWHEPQMKVAAGFMWPRCQVMRDKIGMWLFDIKAEGFLWLSTNRKLHWSFPTQQKNWCQLATWLYPAMAAVLACRHCALCAQRHPALLLGTVWSLWDVWVPASCWNHEESSQLPVLSPQSQLDGGHTSFRTSVCLDLAFRIFWNSSDSR